MTPEAMMLLSLCVAGVAHLLVHERGPFGWLQLFRQFVGARMETVEHDAPGGFSYTTTDCAGTNELARMLCCTVCCSFWLALLAVIVWHLVSGDTMANPVYGFVSWLVIFQLSRIWQRLSIAA